MEFALNSILSSRFLGLITFIFLSGCATVQNVEPVPDEESIEPAKQISYKSEEIILNHKFYVISYNKENRIANWVRYVLLKKDLKGSGVRLSRFKPDPLLIQQGIEPVRHDDYTNSGYARGHLAPAEDFSRSQEAIESTFYMSNVIPQKGSINSGSWAGLEKKVREWACGEEKITVITGPILKKNLLKIKGSISVPQEFFKLVIDETPPKKAIAFVYNQTDKNQSIHSTKNKVSVKALIADNHLEVENVKDSTVDEWKSCK